MSYEDDLKKLRAIKKKGCVAFVKMESATYYAVNGPEEGLAGETNISKALESMHETNVIIRCVFDDSYTVINPKMFGHYVVFKKNVDKMLNSLDTTREISIEDIIIPMKHNDNYDNSNWTCCERKIIGYLRDNGIIKYFHSNTELYITKRPCLLCIPLVRKAYYLDDNLNIKFDEYKQQMVDINTMKITI